MKSRRIESRKKKRRAKFKRHLGQPSRIRESNHEAITNETGTLSSLSTSHPASKKLSWSIRTTFQPKMKRSTNNKKRVQIKSDEGGSVWGEWDEDRGRKMEDGRLGGNNQERKTSDWLSKVWRCDVAATNRNPVWKAKQVDFVQFGKCKLCWFTSLMSWLPTRNPFTTRLGSTMRRVVNLLMTRHWQPT